MLKKKQTLFCTTCTTSKANTMAARACQTTKYASVSTGQSLQYYKSFHT